MDFGLSENFADRVSPISQHVESLHNLGAPPGPLNKYVNEVTSDVVKVRYVITITTNSCFQILKLFSFCIAA